MEFIGHIITSYGVSAADTKVSAVSYWPILKTMCELQGFMGLLKFYGRFIRSFSTITEQLTSLRKKKDMCLSGLKHVNQR